MLDFFQGGVGGGGSFILVAIWGIKKIERSAVETIVAYNC